MHVACKEIITLEKQVLSPVIFTPVQLSIYCDIFPEFGLILASPIQFYLQMKLLEEEEKEKREDEERKERKRTKEREKKLRRKERLREKENKEKRCAESNTDAVVLDTRNEAEPCLDEGVTIGNTRDCAMETGEATPPSTPLSPDIQDDQVLMDYSSPNMENNHEDILEGDSGNTKDFDTSLPYNQSRYSRRKPRLHKDIEQDLTSKWSDRRKGAALSESELTIGKYESRFHADGFESTRNLNCFNKQLRSNAAKFNSRNGPKLREKLQCTNKRLGDRCDSHICSCNHVNHCEARPELHTMRSTREPKYVNKLESSCDISKSYYRGKCTQVKTNINFGNSPVRKQVWEPLDSQKKCVQSDSGSVIAMKPKVEITESDRVLKSSITAISSELTYISVETSNEDNGLGKLTRSGNETCRDTENGFHSKEKCENYAKVEEAEDGKLCFMARPPLRKVGSLLSSSSNSDSCSSCLSEGDSSSNRQNLESTSTSDSEESSQTSEGRDMLHCLESRFVVDDRITTRVQDANSQELASGVSDALSSLPAETAIYCESGKTNDGVDAQPQRVLPAMMHNQSIQYPIYQAPAMGYYHQAPVSWPAGPTNGLMPFHYPNHYLFANSFGYDLTTNPPVMQYGGLQHLPPPPMNMPVFPPVTQQANVVCTKDATVAEDGQSGKCEKTDDDFSLFHFGGPVGFKAEAVTMRGGRAGDSSLKSSSPDPCSREESIEEYNLFAASNGIKFSIF